MKEKQNFDYDIVVVGGGAAGLAAAITACLSAKSMVRGEASGKDFKQGDCHEPGISVAILEKKEAPGKKLAATGNGRCNLSNLACNDRQVVEDFFQAVGLITKTDDTGRMYPYGEEAREVVRLLVDAARSLHVDIFTDRQMEKLEVLGEGGFALVWNGKDHEKDHGKGGGKAHGKEKEKTLERPSLRCRKVLLAMGGKSYSVFGTTGDGFGLARRLGHKVTRLAPSLVPIQVAEDISSLAGVRTKAKVSLQRWSEPQGRDGGKESEVICAESGEVQFNKDSLSGICIMNLSRLLNIPDGMTLSEGFGRYHLELDLVPDYEEAALAEMLAQRAAALVRVEGMDIDVRGEGVDTEKLLRTLVKEKLAAWLAKLSMPQAQPPAEPAASTALAVGRPACPLEAGAPAASEGLEARQDPERTADLETPADLETWAASLAYLLKHLSFQVTGTKGWNDAQVTRGGVALEEVDEQTMESAIVPGVYFAGEILDYDGPCGGYNLHFAWKSGVLAGRSMAEAVVR